MSEFKLKKKLKKEPQLYVGKQFTYGINTYHISSYNPFDDAYRTRCGKVWTGAEEFFRCIEDGSIQIIH